MRNITIRAAAAQTDRNWLIDTWRQIWGDVIVVARGRVYRLADLPALIAWDGTERVGEATYHVEGDLAELTSITAMESGRGVGTALIAAVENAARAAGARRLWLITTNDNLDALRFYQRRGFHLAAVHRDAIEESRRLKPQIPRVGDYGIEIRDELELEILP